MNYILPTRCTLQRLKNKVRKASDKLKEKHGDDKYEFMLCVRMIAMGKPYDDPPDVPFVAG